MAGDNDSDRDTRPEDQFTPSARNDSAQAAQDAGLFSVSQVQIFSASADFLLAQAGASPTSQAPATAADAAAWQPASADAASLANTNTPAVPVAAASAGSTGDTNAQDPLQEMNQALAALGLNQQEIQVVDQIANLIKAFNPAAFSDLVKQLDTLAKQFGPQAASSPAATASDNSKNNPAGGGFQLQELVIRFSGVEAQGTSGAANGSSQGSLQVSAFSLQVEEIKLTLSDSNGQPVRVQAPQQTANGVPPVNNPTAQTPAA